MRLEIPIEVKSGELMPPNRRNKKSGNGSVVGEQIGWVDFGNGRLQEIRIPIELGGDVYPTGAYFLDPTCLYADRFGDLSLQSVRLVPRMLRPERA